MALKLSDLVFDSASCCGSHDVARYVDNQGTELYVKREGGIYSVMQLKNGVLNGAIRNGLSGDDVELILSKIE